MKKLDLKRAIGGGGHEELLKYFGGACFEKQRCQDTKRQNLLRFELFRKIKKILDLIKRNILISPLEGEKKFNPLTKREGSDSVITNNLINMNHSLFLDTAFSRFTSHYFSRKRTAFTLAEVLITLGIIGIVAALTFPTLIANYRVSVLKNDFKKADTIIQQAIQKTVTEAGYDDITSFNIPGRHVTTENWAELQNQTAELNEYWLKQFSVTKAVTENELTKLKY